MTKKFRYFLLAAVFSASYPLFAQSDIESILADPTRPAEDRMSDARRMPAAVLDFFGIGTGDKVADLLSGSGYYTFILSKLVGEGGTVYAGNNPFFAQFGDEALTALVAQPGIDNVVRIDGPVDELALPADGSLDAVMMILAYHDLWLTDEDRAEMNRRILAALKPGGVYGIIDHHAAAGAGSSVIQSLHRIEQSVIVEEVSSAGFSLAATADFLSNPEDDRSLRIFDPEIRGRTDRFVLRFEKP
jgi:predicted methyltransferase